MSDAAPAHPPLKPCGFTKRELIDLLKEADKSAIRFDRYFFTNVTGSAIRSDGTQMYPRRDDVEDDTPRCKECGCTIGEHNNPALSQVALTQSPPSQKLEARVIRAATYRNFRKHVYGLAVRHGAYDEEINYNESPISSNADLLLTLYFPSTLRAMMLTFRADFLDLVQRYRGAEPAIQMTPSDHSCTALTTMSSMNANKTESDRQNCQPDDVSDATESSVHHNELTTEETQRECLCDFQWFSRSNQKALWCRILPKKRCRTEDEKKGSANRLVMNWSLHSMFDANLMNDNAIPTLSAYCEPNAAVEPTTNGFMLVTVHVVFKNSVDAEVYAKCLRQPVRQLSATDFIVTVEKKTTDVAAFTNYLRQRHDEVFKRW